MPTPPQPRVALITLNWRRAQDTIDCLRSARAQTLPFAQIIVVDNGSDDGSVAAIRAADPQAEILALPRNLGFAGGANAGLRHALAGGYDYLFLLNNDTLLAADCLAELLAAAQQQPTAVLVPAIFYHEQPQQPWSLGGRLNRLTLEKDGDNAAVLAEAVAAGGLLRRDLVNGCALFLPRPVLEHIGLFDEDFFMYYEDMDFSLRLWKAKVAIYLVAAAKLWHRVAASSGGMYSVNERYWMARSSVLYFRKHSGPWRALPIVAYRSASALKLSLRLLRQRRFAPLRAYWRGLRDGLSGRGR